MRLLKATACALAAMMCAATAAEAQAPPVNGLSPGDRVDQAALESSSQARRDGEIARVIAAADEIFPYYYAPLVSALYRKGAPAGARQWNANALLRLMIDIDFMGAAGESAGGLADFLSFYRMALQRDPHLAAFLDSDPRAQADAIERAIAWELATPRRYLLTDRFTIDAERAREGGFVAALPERARAIFADAQARQIANARAAAERRAASADLLDDAAAAVREGRPAREAIEAVPEDMRARLVARRSVKLACPGEIRFAAGAAVSEGASQAAIVCGELESDTFQIVDLATGATLRRAPTSGLDHAAGAFSADGALTLFARRDYAKAGDPRGLRPSHAAPLYALTAQAPLKRLRLPVPSEVTARHEVSGQSFLISRSGRIASFSFMREITGAADPVNTVVVVYDLSRGVLLWRGVRPFTPAAEGRPQSEEVVGAFIDEAGPFLVSLVREARDRRLHPAAIERVNLDTGAPKRLALPEGVENVEPLPYGPGRALMYMHTESAAEAAQRASLVIDLARMRIAWRGRWENRPAEAIARPVCALISYEEGEFWTVQAPSLAQPIKLDPLRGQPWSSCAASADGRHVALVLPPYAHVYELTQP